MTVLPPGHPGDLLSAHLDGELAPDVAAAVEAHVSACPECAEELAELGATRLALRSAPRLSAPPGFARDLVRTRRRASRRGAALALVAASVAVVAGLVLAPGQPRRLGRPPEPRPAVAGLAVRGQRRRPDDHIGDVLAAGGARHGCRRGFDDHLDHDAHATTTPTSTSTTSPPAGAGGEGGDGDRSVGERVGDAVGALLDAIGG